MPARRQNIKQSQTATHVPVHDFANTSVKNQTENGTEPWSTKSRGFCTDLKTLRWAIVPSSSLKILLIFGALWAKWEILAPYFARDTPNPFSPLLFLSHRIPTSSDDDPRYRKGYLDLVFLAYYVVFWSFVRQSITIYFFRPLGRHFGLKKVAKLDRFAEQGYSVLYWGAMAAWGVRIMSQLPTWWYQTQYFWIDYPHWDMKAELKRYYLMQTAYWLHQSLVMILGLEKPRKDHNQLMLHHIVTVWLVGASYLINLTLIGNAVFLSMDLPDTFLNLALLLNSLRSPRTVIIPAFAVFFCTWIYFRHWINWTILYSVLFEFDLRPASSQRLAPEEGVWLVSWVKYQIFAPLSVLQGLNIFWFFMISRLAYRAATGARLSDIREDEEVDEDKPTSEPPVVKDHQ